MDDKELTEQQFFGRELAQNDTFKYLNASQRRQSYRKYLQGRKQAKSIRKDRLEKKIEDEREAEYQEKAQIQSLGQLESAKISKRVAAKFDTGEILDVIEFFETTAQLYEAIVESHAKLKPEYRKEIISWCLENTDLQTNQLEYSDKLDGIVQRCMNQGLSAICKTDPICNYLKNQTPNSEANCQVEDEGTRRIEKRRSWREISSTEDS